MNQTEIDELRRLASVSREPRHGIGCIASDCALASAARNALPRLLAALEEARAERSEARSLLLNGIQTNGDSLAFLEHVRREHAAVVAERDAIKEKLAALVTDIEAAMHFVNHTACLPVCGLYCTPPSRCTCGVNDIRNALAAAKVQPTDLDQLTR